MNRYGCVILCLTTLLNGPATAQVYDFPFRSDDLHGNERVWWERERHVGESSDVQFFGFDLGILRNVDGRWQEMVANDRTDKRNWYVYDTPVYAMRGGTVIGCWRFAPENRRDANGNHVDAEELFDPTLIYGGGNHLWVLHEDGTRAEYAHLKPGSIPASLCPNRNRKLLPEPIPSPNVQHAWPHIQLRPFDRRRVEAGQFIGRVGYAGTGNPPHLHVHVERGPQADFPDPHHRDPVEFEFRRGLFAPKSSDTEPLGEWTSFAGRPLPPGPILIWPPLKQRNDRVLIGVPAEDFQAHFNHFRESGYQPELIDGYHTNGKAFVNAIWRPVTRQWRAFWFLDENRYVDEVNAADAAGFEPVFVDSSVRNNRRTYSVIFAKGVPGGFNLRHRKSLAEHEGIMNEARDNGLVPIAISVISVGGQREYTVLYRSGTLPEWRIRSRTKLSDFQELYDAESATGRKPVYLNVYSHDGQRFVSSIFGKRGADASRDRHSLSPITFSTNYRQARDDRLLTRALTGFDGHNTHRFGALWWK